MIIKLFGRMYLRNIVIISIAIFQPTSLFNFYKVDFKSYPKKEFKYQTINWLFMGLVFNNNVHNVGKKSFKKVEIRRVKITYNIRV